MNNHYITISLVHWAQQTDAANRHRSLHGRAQEGTFVSNPSSVCFLRCSHDTTQTIFPSSCWSRCISYFGGLNPERPSDSRYISSGLRLQGVCGSSLGGLYWQPALLQKLCCCPWAVSSGEGVTRGSQQVVKHLRRWARARQGVHGYHTAPRVLKSQRHTAVEL